MAERNYGAATEQLDPKDARTPSIVSRSWVNFADRKDPVSLDVHLSNDYAANATGIEVRHDLVLNDYRKPQIGNDGSALRDADGKKNPHKSYGYLRTPEFSDHVRAFLRA